MQKYRVRDGQQLPHNGQVLDAGAEVELSRGLAYEVRHLVVEVDAAGSEVTAPVPPWHAELSNRPDREQAFALQKTRDQAADRVEAFSKDFDARTQDAEGARLMLSAAKASLADIDRAIEAYLATPPPVHELPDVPMRRVPDELETETPVATADDDTAGDDASAHDHNQEAADTDVRPSSTPRTKTKRS